MSEYRWKWCQPDKKGVYMYAGFNPDSPGADFAFQIVVDDSEDSEEREFGWYCYVMAVPEILPPKKQVTEVMWVLMPECTKSEGSAFSTMASWVEQGKTVLSTENLRWVPTSITRSYER